MKFTFAHNNFNVMNLEKSLAFYKKALQLTEMRRHEAPDGSFILVFLGDDNTPHQLELTWLRDRKDPYNLGDNEFHLAFKVDDFAAAHALHEKMGCICFENKAMGIYFINDPDDYWIEIIPQRDRLVTLQENRERPRFMKKAYSKMKKFVFGMILFASVMILPLPAMAQASVRVSVPLPPPIIFPTPPHVVVLPETYVYAVPDAQEDIFFYNGWWWRPWQGRWYRSRYYDRGWGHYNRVPAFYSNIHQGWRDDYRNHRWKGHQWDHHPIGHQDLNRNWNGWQRDKHWEKQDRWRVQGLQVRPQAHEVQHSRERNRVHPQQTQEVKPQGKRHKDSLEPGHRQPQTPEQNHQGRGKQGKEGEEHRDRR